MSYICGCFCKRKEGNMSDYINILMNESKCYKTEPLVLESFDNAMLGCGIQRFSLFSDDEILPIKDEKRGILFTADCIIDNRNELTESLGITKAVSDSELLYRAYIKWDRNFAEHVCGSFAFAVYHKTQNKLVLCSDHMNTRSMYYYSDKEMVVFSNTIVPLAGTVNAKLSEKWCAACLYSVSADLTIYDSLSPYEGILQLEPACFMTITEDHQEKTRYWSPLKIKFDKPEKTENEYREEFLDTFKKCVHEMLQVKGRKGCTLSGGLDSTSVAALAALELGDEALFSFTSVPEKEFDELNEDKKADRYAVSNESKGVRNLCEKYRNIDPEFVDCTGKDAFSELDRLIPRLGYPMKSAQNLTWLDAIYSRAEENGIRLILKGQFGNSTISYGNSLSAFYQELARFRPGKAINSARSFMRKNHISKKRFIKAFFAEVLKKIKRRRLEDENILTNPELIKANRTDRDMRAFLSVSDNSYIQNRKQRLLCLYDPVAENQLGMFDTIMGLLHGIIIRDPTKDKRIVELCAKLPPSCMVAGGYERGQVRTFMEGYVPETILKDIHHRGEQGADYYFRVRKYWGTYKDEVIKAISHPELLKYVNPEIAENLLSIAKNREIKDITDEDIRKINVIYSFALFMKTGKEQSDR